MTGRPCIEPGCHLIAQVGARCPGHTKAKGHTKNRRRATLAPPGGAASQLRATINRAGWGTCAHCPPGVTWPARTLEVDHRQALADGGRDTPDNVQLLCLTHHRTKSADERRARHRTQ